MDNNIIIIIITIMANIITTTIQCLRADYKRSIEAEVDEEEMQNIDVINSIVALYLKM